MASGAAAIATAAVVVIVVVATTSSLYRAEAWPSTDARLFEDIRQQNEARSNGGTLHSCVLQPLSREFSVCAYLSPACASILQLPRSTSILHHSQTPPPPETLVLSRACRDWVIEVRSDTSRTNARHIDIAKVAKLPLFDHRALSSFAALRDSALLAARHAETESESLLCLCASLQVMTDMFLIPRFADAAGSGPSPDGDYWSRAREVVDRFRVPDTRLGAILALFRSQLRMTRPSDQVMVELAARIDSRAIGIADLIRYHNESLRISEWMRQYEVLTEGEAIVGIVGLQECLEYSITGMAAPQPNLRQMYSEWLATLKAHGSLIERLLEDDRVQHRLKELGWLLQRVAVEKEIK